jgi:hypothetical protein
MDPIDVEKSWSLYYMQFDSAAGNSFSTYTEKCFSEQAYFQHYASISNQMAHRLVISVPQLLIDCLKKFGIECIYNSFKNEVLITRFEPITMVAWEDLQPADIFCCGGTGIPSVIIRYGTWSISSHTAFYEVYEGRDYVLESLNHGIERRSKGQFLSPSDGTNMIFVKRRKNRSIAYARRVVEAARRNVRVGIEPYGDNPKDYAWNNLAGAGSSTPTGKAIAIASSPLIPAIVVANENADLQRKVTNAIVSAGKKANELVPVTTKAGNPALHLVDPALDLAQKMWGGSRGRYICSEAVIVWHNEAGIPITNMRPQDVPPALIAGDAFMSTLEDVGYLRHV